MLIILDSVVSLRYTNRSLFPKTRLTTVGEDFHINGRPTYEGCNWNGHRVEGLLMNSRMVQGVFEAADQLGMVAIVGYFYFGQDQNLTDQAAVINATDQATAWLLDGGWENVIVEVNNETNVNAYDHEILKPERIHELIKRVRAMNHQGRAVSATPIKLPK